MKPILLTTMTALVACSLSAAGAALDDVKSAAQKLAGKATYSWTSTVKNEGGGGGGGGGGRGGQGPSEGKTEKDGYSFIVTKLGDAGTREAAIKGEKFAVKGQDGWQSSEELAQAGGGGQGGRGGFAARAYRNFKKPAAEAEDLASKVKELKKNDDGSYSGDLTAEAAKEVMSRRGRGGQAPEISDAKASVKFWVKDGLLSKYESRVSGKTSFNGNDINIDRTTTVEIKDVDSTKVEVPDEAKKKVG